MHPPLLKILRQHGMEKGVGYEQEVGPHVVQHKNIALATDRPFTHCPEWVGTLCSYMGDRYGGIVVIETVPDASSEVEDD